MKRIFNIATYINLLICLLLICSCTKTSMYDVDTDDTDPTSGYINLSFGTRSTLPSLDENKESGVSHLRVIIFDATGEKVSNTKYTVTNAGRVPNPVIKVSGGQKYTIYTIANENNIPIANVLPNKYLTEVLDGVKKISDVEAVAVQLTLVDYSGLPNAGLLMVGSTEVDAKFGHSMIYPQDVSIAMKRLTSKITLNARREAGMTVAIKKVVAKNVHQHEYLIAKSPDYTYPPKSQVATQTIPISVGGNVSEGSGASFTLFDRYFLGTNYAGDKLFFSMDITYEQKVGTGATETKTTTLTIPSAVERNMEYTFNLNFLLSTVKVNLSVKDWDDQAMSGEVVGGTSLSLSQSELTMYGSHKSTIYLQTDATKVEAELNTEGGEPASKYFTNLQGGIAVSNGSGAIVLTPIKSAMSSDPAKPTQIGLYFKTGNIRKLVRVTHINQEAYAINLDANGGTFVNPNEKIRSDGSMAIGSGYTIKNSSTLTPTRADYVFLGWSLSKVALLKDFSLGDNVSYEDLERPKELLTLYAVWDSATKASLMFDPNGKMATNIPAVMIGSPNAKVTIPTTVPLANGGDYIFKEWNTKADGTGTKYGAGSQFTLGNELSILYAIWNSRPVKITLLSNTAPTSPETVLATYTETQDSRFTITVADPSRDKHYFKGWNTLRNGTGTYYAKNTSHPAPSIDLILYAVWSPYHTLSFDVSEFSNRFPVTIHNLKAGDVVKLDEYDHWTKEVVFFYPYAADGGNVGKNSYHNWMLYWQDSQSPSGFYFREGKITMPERDVVLTAIYPSISSFPFWNHVGGTSWSYHISTSYQGRLQGLARFGYWGRYHTVYFQSAYDVEIKLDSSWEWPPHFGILIRFKNGKRRWENHSDPNEQWKNRTTVTLITAREISDNGGIDNVQIINSYPVFNPI